MGAGRRTDGRTDMTKVKDALRNFEKKPKNDARNNFDMEHNDVNKEAMLMVIILEIWCTIDCSTHFVSIAEGKYLQHRAEGVCEV
jgi:hypothetical protein